ncbi:VanZ family protein [Bacillus sp. UMB0899]|nr:VanZ family protein [Bacillus sp. UMB0899]
MKIKKSILYICFLSYLSLLLYLLFFSAYRQSVEGEIAYNLIPFKTIEAYFLSFDGFTLTDPFIGNILAFLPLGVFLPWLFRRMDSFRRVVLGSFLLSMSVEVLQLLFRVGAFDVDDLLLNTLGGGFGFCLFWVVKKSRLISE